MSYHSLPGGANIKYVNSKWVPFYKEKIKPKFTWLRGHPAGYTDDLGIIADRNQWVEAESPGWFSEVDPQDYMAIREWCKQTLKHGDWCTGPYYVILQNDEDVSWFMLRWS